MPRLLQLSEFSLSVGSTQLLDGVAAQITDGQRIALVGPNGCGKSTLLRALAGASSTARSSVGSTASEGEGDDYFLVGAGGVSGPLSTGDGVLLVEQDNLQWSRLLLAAECDEEELREMTLPDALDMAAAVGDEDALEGAESWRRLSVAAQDALGWRTAGYDATPLGQLSPGCSVRAYLAVALARRDVQLLLLDEPTNHLDLPSILWLQEAILASGKAIVVVSHDGAFLDAVAERLWDVDPQEHSLTVSGASYSAYKRAKELAREQQRAAWDQQQKRHKRLSAVADNLRAASAAGQRHKASDHDIMQRDFRRDRAGRSGKKAKAVETLRDKEDKVDRVMDRAPLRIILEDVAGGSHASIILGSAVLGYGGEPLPLPPVSLRVDFGERVAIVGFNGAGKSTLLRTITGSISPLGGDVAVGRDLTFGSLTQEHEALPRDETPREFISKLTGIEPFAAGVRLMQYGLTRQQVDRPIGQLNPGARARALLASFSLRQVNALILDEPTNHLDEEAMAEVTATLNEYKGTVLVVSHSRDFLEELELTKMLLLSPKGLSEVESLDAFLEAAEETVRGIVRSCMSY